MKNNTRRLVKVIICIFIALTFSGCWNSRELDTLGIIVGVGLDKPEESGRVQITAQVVKPGEIKSSKGKDGGGGSNAFWNVTNTGDTIFGTFRGTTNQSSRKFYFPHNQIIIISRSLAEEGIQEYIDFFERDPETRSNVLVLIAEGKAADILEVKSEMEKLPASNIAKLITRESAATSQTIAVKLRELMLRLMSKTTAPFLPFIKVLGEGDKKIAIITGTAIFKGDKLVGEMNRTEGRGISWILGKVKGGIIEFESPSNEKISMEIIRASSKMVPQLIDNKVVIKVDILEEGNLGEQASPENLSKLPMVSLLEKKKAAVIRDEVMAAVKKAQELNTDVFGFGDAIHQKYPKQWKSMEKDWDKIFPDIKVEVNVEAKLRLMGRILVPSVPEGGKK